MPTCIYCRQENKLFDRDHVLPEAYGTFEPNSFVLHDAVCQSCNNQFGVTLEWRLARDSMEALLRLRHGVKPASEAKDLRCQRLELTIGQPGPWCGAIVTLEPDTTGNAIEPVPVPQVGFHWKHGEDWTYFPEARLNASTLVPYVKPQPGTLDIRVMGPSLGDHQRLVEKLKECGINFLQEGSLNKPVTEDGTVRLEIASALDDTIFRAIAKIAFNYMAHQHGSSFALLDDFDDVRQYIRNGIVPQWAPVVMPFRQPILFDDSPRYRQTNGHLITFDWNSSQNGFVSRVSLFNAITYHVALCPHFKGIWRDDLRRGHHFDFETRTIDQLGSTSSLLLVPPQRIRGARFGGR